jgi:hypothetical protein
MVGQAVAARLADDIAEESENASEFLSGLNGPVIDRDILFFGENGVQP